MNSEKERREREREKGLSSWQLDSGVRLGNLIICPFMHHTRSEKRIGNERKSWLFPAPMWNAISSFRAHMATVSWKNDGYLKKGFYSVYGSSQRYLEECFFLDFSPWFISSDNIGHESPAVKNSTAKKRVLFISSGTVTSITAARAWKS